MTEEVSVAPRPSAAFRTMSGVSVPPVPGCVRPRAAVTGGQSLSGDHWTPVASGPASIWCDWRCPAARYSSPRRTRMRLKLKQNIRGDSIWRHTGRVRGRRRGAVCSDHRRCSPVSPLFDLSREQRRWFCGVHDRCQIHDRTRFTLRTDFVGPTLYHRPRNYHSVLEIGRSSNELQSVLAAFSQWSEL